MTRYQFFLMEVPAMLKQINSDSKPEWGEMNVGQMLDHLRRGIDLSLANLDIEILTPPEKLPAYKDFLMSNRLFKKDSAKPKHYNEMPTFDGDIEDLKVNLMKAVVRMLSFFENNPDYTAIHPNFGRLNTIEWLQMHKKHFTHHFKQFGVKVD